MTGNDRPSNVTDIRSRRRYAPDLVSLTCSQVAAARERAGLSVAEFADALRELLKWPQLAPDLVRAWESTVDPPGRVLTACAMITRQDGTDPAAAGDEVAAAAAEAEAEQAWLLAEPGQLSVASLWDEAARMPGAEPERPGDLWCISPDPQHQPGPGGADAAPGGTFRSVHDRRAVDGADGIHRV